MKNANFSKSKENPFDGNIDGMANNVRPVQTCNKMFMRIVVATANNNSPAAAKTERWLITWMSWQFSPWNAIPLKIGLRHTHFCCKQNDVEISNENENKRESARSVCTAQLMYEAPKNRCDSKFDQT